MSFRSEDIPVTGDPREVIDEEIPVLDKTFRFSAATIGNPHCVVLNAQVTKETVCKYGPAIENDTRFPNRTNVQFMKILDRANIRIEIWERGAGYTLASGSSSSAAAAVAHKLGLCDPEIRVHMPGGTLDIVISDDFSIRMKGPVTKVSEGTIHKEIFEDAF